MLIALGAVAGGAAAADTPLATEPAATSVTAYGGLVAWSHRENGRFRLRLRYNGKIVDARAPGRTVPFDVDAGPSPTGRPMLVYSRCRHEPVSVRVDATSLPAWNNALGCDLYRYDPVSRREQKLGRVSRSAVSETLPSLWKDQIAFSAVAEPENAAAARVPRIALARVSTGVRRQFAGGPLGRITGTGSDGLHPGPTSIDLRASTIGLSWSYYGQPCPDNSAVDGPLGGTHSEDESVVPSQIIEISPTTRRVRSRSCNGENVISAFWKDNALAWVRQDGDTVRGAYTPPLRRAQGVISAAADGGSTISVQRGYGADGQFSLVATAPDF